MLQIVYVTASWEEFEKFGKFMSIKGEIVRWWAPIMNAQKHIVK